MMSVNSFFYGESEPVWIIDPKEGTVMTDVPYYIPPSTHSSTVAKPVAEKKPGDQKLELKVPMCCGSCEDRVMAALRDVKGVMSVDANVHTNKVTVTGNAAAADVLMACKRVFKKSKMWKN